MDRFMEKQFVMRLVSTRKVKNGEKNEETMQSNFEYICNDYSCTYNRTDCS